MFNLGMLELLSELNNEREINELQIILMVMPRGVI